MSEQKNTNAPEFVAPMTKGKNAEFATGLAKPTAVGCDVPAGDGIATKEFVATTTNPGTPITLTNNPNTPNLPGNVPHTANNAQKNADGTATFNSGNPKAV